LSILRIFGREREDIWPYVGRLGRKPRSTRGIYRKIWEGGEKMEFSINLSYACINSQGRARERTLIETRLPVDLYYSVEKTI
jgi:hypothetical protein